MPRTRHGSHPLGGYESGMHFIAGVLVAVMEAEEAFWCLCSIIAPWPLQKDLGSLRVFFNHGGLESLYRHCCPPGFGKGFFQKIK